MVTMTPAALSLLFLTVLNILQALTGAKHSLEYLYTIQSKNSVYNLYDCTAVTVLDGRQIDFYSSTYESRTPKQNWLKNISESDWNTSTEKLQSDGQFLNKIIDIQMNMFKHLQSDGHVLQWRHGCEGEQSSDGSLTVLNSINEFGYDGEDLIQFNCTSKTWFTSVIQKEGEIKKWNTELSLVKRCVQCEEMLKMYSKYKTDITHSHTPPTVHILAKKSVHEWRKLILTCLITGFYPKDVKMSLRKFTTEIPDHLITSSGVRPNDDGTYQLRKSVEIQEDDKADYDCYMNHSSLTEPVIKQWDGKCSNCSVGRSRTGLIIVLILVVVLIICVLIYKKRQCVNNSSAPSDPGSTDDLLSNSNGGVPNGTGSPAGSKIVSIEDHVLKNGYQPEQQSYLYNLHFEPVEDIQCHKGPKSPSTLTV